MTDKVTLTLTRSEAIALEALADSSAARLFSGEMEIDEFAQALWSMETAAAACDKLREAVAGESPEHTWTKHLEAMRRIEKGQR